jgi:3-oxoacyl-[acyl-carrier protein] reductase
LHHLGKADEVAAAIAFLTSESASYLTGQLIIIDGGNALRKYKGSARTLLLEVRQPN